VDKVSGCRAAAQFPDQTVFQMAQIQSGTDKAWLIFISNPKWNAWTGKRKELRLQLVTDWPTTKPWPYKFSISEDSKILSTVCRQNISDDLRLSLREYLAHRV
jgi:hypothetical protein